MSWISDVKAELKQLDTSKKSLRKYAFVVGGIFLIVSIWLSYRGMSALLYYLIGVIGIILITAGIFTPSVLKNAYKIWMGMAFAIGWVVSRLLLVMIFYIVVMPIGLTARFLGKEFLDIRLDKSKDTYWIKRDGEKKVDYEKMY